MKLAKPEKRIEPNSQNPNNAQSNLNLHDSEGPDSSENSSHSNSLLQKKTRDLPNLTECHACGFKVDFCTSKNGLHTLYSEWRIVLLCKKCFSSVETSRICSYCFSETTAECFRCNQCKHAVHKNCFLKYKDAAPWSYACLGSEFSICVDCWIPKSFAISRRGVISGRKVRKKARVESEKGSSKVLDGGNSEKSLQDVVKKANHMVEKKIEAAARAREQAVNKAVVARRAVELANNALSLVANRDNNSLNELKTDSDKVVYDAELAFQLHSPMNSSPKISKSCCLMNASYLDTPKIWVSSINSLCKTLNPRTASCLEKHEASNDNKLYVDSHKYVCEPSVSINALDRDSSTDVNCLDTDRNDMRNGSKDGEHLADCDAREDTGEELLKEGEGSCSNRLINFGGEDSSMDLDRKQADSGLHGEDRCNGQPCRYFLKYSRRRRLKPIADGKSKILNEGNYLESQGSAAGFSFNCSWELRTLSHASCQSIHAPLQASACETGYFSEPS